MEHEVLSGWPSTIIGEPMAAMVFSATCCAPSSWSSRRFSRITANSSPPRRATVSLARTQAVSRAATAFRSWSPTAWPSESLMVLKRSRSMNMKAKPGLVARRVVHRLLEAVVQQHAVGQLRERVARGEPLGALLRALAVGDVGGGAGHAQRPARLVALRHLAARVDPDPVARGVGHAVLAVEAVAHALGGVAHGGGELLAILGMVPARHLGRR